MVIEWYHFFEHFRNIKCVLNYFWTKNKSFSWCLRWPPSTCRKDRAVVVGNAVCVGLSSLAFFGTPQIRPTSFHHLCWGWFQKWNNHLPSSTYLYERWLDFRKYFRFHPIKKMIETRSNQPLFHHFFVGAASKYETIIILI